ncbi:CoA-disulfide reductase [Flavobacterium litorale]|nr:CoA-disulfide reductase [Flavobacterium litorale]
MGNKLVVIGGDAAGMSAASKVRRVQPEREIVVFEKSEYTSYSACGIPYFISGMVPDMEELIARTPKQFRDNYDIDVRTQCEVVAVNTVDKKIKVLNKGNDTTFWQNYDDLLIATGGKAICPDIEGKNAKNVFGISTLKSGEKTERYIEDKNPKKAVIVGAGYIGLEMAEALIIRGLEVTIIDRSEQVMGTLDPDMAEKIAEAIIELGITLHLKEDLKEFEISSNQVVAVKSDKRTISTDMVILGMGTLPNTVFLENSGIELGTKNAIKVNNKMQTNVANVWAAGDCTATFDIVSQNYKHIALGTIANKTGLVAGSNLANEPITFPGVVGTAVTKICDYEVARTGLTEKELKKLNIEYVTGTIKSKTRAGYYPDAEDITVKLLAEKKTGRLLGGQIIGKEGAAKRIDVLATALTTKLTLQNIIDLDLSYAPPFSPVWDPVQTAARYLIKKI